MKATITTKAAPASTKPATAKATKIASQATGKAPAARKRVPATAAKPTAKRTTTSTFTATVLAGEKAFEITGQASREDAKRVKSSLRGASRTEGGPLFGLEFTVHTYGTPGSLRVKIVPAPSAASAKLVWAQVARIVRAVFPAPSKPTASVR